MPASVPKTGAQYNLSLIPFTRDLDANSTSWLQASSTVLTIPKVLLNFYDQRVSVQLVGEMLNAQAALAFIDGGGNPQSDLLAQIFVPEPSIIRRASELTEISGYLRNGQIQCLALFCRMVVTSFGYIARNFTAVLYFGSVPIGRQIT